MAKIVAICNQKGGVGKTTTAVNLSCNLALFAGKSIILVDVDPQGNATSGVGLDKTNQQITSYDVLLGKASATEAILSTPVENLRLIPANIDLTGAEVELVEIEDRDMRLKQALASIKDAYDFIIIDSPPSLGLLTINALAAADTVLIPLQCEYYALEGLTQLIQIIDLVRANLNPALSIEGVVLTMADYRTNLTIEVIGEVKNFFKEKVFETIIPRNIRLSEAPSFGKPITLYDSKSIGAERYRQLTDEFLRRNNLSANAQNSEVLVRDRSI